MRQPSYVKRADESYREWFLRQSQIGFCKIDDEGGVIVDDDAVRRLVEDDAEREPDHQQTKHLVDTLSDLMVAGSEGRLTKPAAIRHLLFSDRGNALVHRMRAARKQQPTTKKEKPMTDNRADELVSIAKADRGSGIFVVAERTLQAINKGEKPLVKNEHEATALIVAAAKAAGTTFAELYEGEETLRRFVQAVKSATVAGFPLAEIMPRSTNADEAPGAGGSEADAYDQLQKLVDGQRNKFPFMSRDALFAKVVDENPELFTLERRQSRARLAATLPRMPG
jgi:hypothetical protein